MADRIALVALLAGAFPHLADNAPTLDLWSEELSGTGQPLDVLEEAIRRHARTSRWASLAGVLEEVRDVRLERAETANVDHALEEVTTWTEEDERAAREVAARVLGEWRAKHPPKTTGAPERPRMETPGEEYFSPPSSPQEPGESPDGPLTEEEPGPDDAGGGS